MIELTGRNTGVRSLCCSLAMQRSLKTQQSDLTPVLHKGRALGPPFLSDASPNYYCAGFRSAGRPGML